MSVRDVKGIYHGYVTNSGILFSCGLIYYRGRLAAVKHRDLQYGEAITCLYCLSNDIYPLMWTSHTMIDTAGIVHLGLSWSCSYTFTCGIIYFTDETGVIDPRSSAAGAPLTCFWCLSKSDCGLTARPKT
jgi:hypothetical protein